MSFPLLFPEEGKDPRLALSLTVKDHIPVGVSPQQKMVVNSHPVSPLSELSRKRAVASWDRVPLGLVRDITRAPRKLCFIVTWKDGDSHLAKFQQEASATYSNYDMLQCG